MEIQDVKRSERKEVRINLKISKQVSKWMKENEVSPQKIFDKSIEELMNKTIKQ